jgi:hypothetical protein
LFPLRKWEEIIQFAETTPGTLSFPVQSTPSGQIIGADVLTQMPEVSNKNLLLLLLDSSHILILRFVIFSHLFFQKKK